VKDRAFSGRDVAEAVALASKTLGVSPSALRYVVLEAGRPGGLGISASPARIAVLVDSGRPERRSPAPDLGDDEEEEDNQPGDPQADVRALVRDVGEAAGLDLVAEIDSGKETFVVRLGGNDRRFWLGDGEAEVLQAFEHLLQRIFGPEISPRRLVVECEGYREVRDEALRGQARKLAAEVRADGLPRETPPLNSYERRIIHMTIAEEPGLSSFSVGEGSDRRVTVALAASAPDPDHA
jgi:spoIIIJ-associated protein